MDVPTGHYLVLAAILFSIGVFGVLFRRNVIVMLMSVELMLNAVNVTFVAAFIHLPFSKTYRVHFRR